MQYAHMHNNFYIQCNQTITCTSILNISFVSAFLTINGEIFVWSELLHFFLASVPMMFSSCIDPCTCVFYLAMCSSMWRKASLMPRCLALFWLESTELSHSLKVCHQYEQECRFPSHDKNVGYVVCTKQCLCMIWISSSVYSVQCTMLVTSGAHVLLAAWILNHEFELHICCTCILCA